MLIHEKITGTVLKHSLVLVDLLFTIEIDKNQPVYSRRPYLFGHDSIILPYHLEEKNLCKSHWVSGTGMMRIKLATTSACRFANNTEVQDPASVPDRPGSDILDVV